MSAGDVDAQQLPEGGTRRGTAHRAGCSPAADVLLARLTANIRRADLFIARWKCRQGRELSNRLPAALFADRSPSPRPMVPLLMSRQSGRARLRAAVGRLSGTFVRSKRAGVVAEFGNGFPVRLAHVIRGDECRWIHDPATTRLSVELCSAPSPLRFAHALRVAFALTAPARSSLIALA